MKTIELNFKQAKELYPVSPKWFRHIFKANFPSDVTDRIKTFEDACLELDVDPGANTFSIGTLDEVAYKKLKVVAQALNEGWKPNWKDSNERKWCPYFSLSSGFGFSDSVYGYICTVTGVGSRLCFKNEALARYAGTQFLELYKDFLTL